MKILIFAGGTGSVALQTGLYNYIESKIDGLDTKVITNAFDNGLSTGSVRRVMDGHILGPSDVRKNQTTRFKLEHPSSPWNKFLDIRFTEPTENAKAFCLSEVIKLEEKLGQDLDVVHDAINTYFSVPAANKIDYNDFSLANIIYAGLAKANGNSLRTAASIMAKLLDIKDTVLLNDDKSLFLGAVTKSGIRVTDEGDIVSWGDVNDPFVDVFFTDAMGNDAMPILNDESKKAIAEADLIILSSGTQWSSLIPTYASIGFKEAIEASTAKIVMVMNRQPDKDSPGQTAADIIDLLVPRYFPTGRIRLVTDIGGHPQMCLTHYDKECTKLKTHVTFDSSGKIDPKSTKHDSTDLAKTILLAAFSEYLSSDCFMFDYDDTLVGRGNKFPKSSQYNVGRIAALNKTKNLSICTGNSIKAINIKSCETEVAKLAVYADGGINLYNYIVQSAFAGHEDDGIKHELAYCTNNSLRFESDGPDSATAIIAKLKQAGIPVSKIENRGNVMLSIKPIDSEYRLIVKNYISDLLADTQYVVYEAGRTTIEIHKDGVSKALAVQDVLSGSMRPEVKTMTYVGDELQSGNDAPIGELAKSNSTIKCLSVKTPVHTALFLMALSKNIE